MSTVVMTGGTSGFGKVAVERMTAAPDVRVLLGARREGTSGAETVPLDLRSLDSARSFARLLARPELDPARDARPRTANGRAYTSSKLCVVLTARALAARRELRDRHVKVVVYCPSHVFGTGLMREGGWALYLMWGLLGGNRTPACRVRSPPEPAAAGPQAGGCGTEPHRQGRRRHRRQQGHRPRDRAHVARRGRLRGRGVP